MGTIQHPDGGNDLRLNIAEHQAKFAAERITQHENKSYDNFSLFLKLSTAIVGGLGYLALSASSNQSASAQNFWIVQKIAWGLYYLEWFVALLFGLSIGLEYTGIRRQWDKQKQLGIKMGKVPWFHILKHIQLYFIIAMIVLPGALYYFLLVPLFK
jgi:hypothetical protein